MRLADQGKQAQPAAGQLQQLLYSSKARFPLDSILDSEMGLLEPAWEACWKAF